MVAEKKKPHGNTDTIIEMLNLAVSVICCIALKIILILYDVKGKKEGNIIELMNT